MLRIEPIEAGGSVVLRLEGRVVGPWVEELRGACESALEQRGRLAVDLAGVGFVDRDGLALLKGLRYRDVMLRNCSAFVSEQLKACAS